MSQDAIENLRTECTDCNEGLRTVVLPKRNRMKLLAQVRRAPRDDQRAVFELLKRKFQTPA